MAELIPVQTIRDAYEAFSRGDIEAVLELFGENIEVRPPPLGPDPEPLRGRESVREYLSPNLFDMQTAEPIDFTTEGDRVLVEARVSIRGSGSGVEIDGTVFHLWHVDGGQAVRLDVHMDREQALAALRA